MGFQNSCMSYSVFPTWSHGAQEIFLLGPGRGGSEAMLTLSHQERVHGYAVQQADAEVACVGHLGPGQEASTYTRVGQQRRYNGLMVQCPTFKNHPSIDVILRFDGLLQKRNVRV